jgi:hypothetical protein
MAKLNLGLFIIRNYVSHGLLAWSLIRQMIEVGDLFRHTDGSAGTYVAKRVGRCIVYGPLNVCLCEELC